MAFSSGAVIAFIDVGLGHSPRSVELFRWIESGNFEAAWALRFDTLLSALSVNPWPGAVITLIVCLAVGVLSVRDGAPRWPFAAALLVATASGAGVAWASLQVDALLDRPLPVPDLGDSGQEEREFGVVSHNGAQPQHAKSGMRVADGSDEASHG